MTQRYLAFSGWPDTKVLLALRTIDKLEKSNTLVYIPNAISIVTSDKGFLWHYELLLIFTLP